jgi:hypothetical protein
MDLFVYKLTLAPALVAVATLAGRRWGGSAAGMVAGLPIIAGPILLFYALEQGPAYASEAAQSTLLGIISLCVFCLAYAWRAWSGASVLSCMGLGWVGFAVFTALIQRVEDAHSISMVRSAVYAVAALFLALRSLPPAEKAHADVDAKPVAGLPVEGPAPESGPEGRPPQPQDLPLRMFASALLVLILTSLAERLGPRLGGLLAPFPVASTVLTVFAHREKGSEGARAVLKGLLLALNAFAAFCLVLGLALAAWGIIPSFVAALAAACLVQAGLVMVWRKEGRLT